MAKRYRETTRRESPLSPLDGDLGPKAWHTIVRDLRTGEKGEGWSDRSREESREKAWRDLREKQGA